MLSGTLIMFVHNAPNTMKAVQGKDYGNIDEVLTVDDGVPIPKLSDLPEGKRKDYMVIKTHAVALAPGDCRVLSGKTREIQGPPSFPYVPGGDCCGVVVELPDGADDLSLPFRLGDRVAVRFLDGPRGALGEYALVSSIVADKVPADVSSEAAAILAGASPALVLAERINPGERVIVFGANGGMGSHLCQLLRNRGASYIVGVSKDPMPLLEPPLSCDEALDYTTSDPLSLVQFQANPFDVIVDLAEGDVFSRLEHNIERGMPSIVKPYEIGGRYITTVPVAGPIFEAHSWWAAVQIFLTPALWRAAYSRSWSRKKLPAYTFAFNILRDRDAVTRMLDMASKGQIRAVADKSGPFPFTTVGVRAAFRLQDSRHAHGKVVIHVANP